MIRLLTLLVCLIFAVPASAGGIIFQLGGPPAVLTTTPAQDKVIIGHVYKFNQTYDPDGDGQACVPMLG